VNLKKGQEEKSFWLGFAKISSSKTEGTRRTLAATIFLTTFFYFFRLIRARLEAASNSTSETCSEDFRFRLVDSRDLAFAG
jgi:hypothetical protein